HGSDQARLGDGALKCLPLPCLQRLRHRRPLIGDPQQLEHAVAMVWEIGVEAHLARITRLIDTGDLVPDRRRWALVDALIALAAKLDRGMARLAADGLPPPRALAPDLLGGERAGGNRRLRDRPDAKRGGQRRLAPGQLDVLQGASLAAGLSPQAPQ